MDEAAGVLVVAEFTAVVPDTRDPSVICEVCAAKRVLAAAAVAAAVAAVGLLAVVQLEWCTGNHCSCTDHEVADSWRSGVSCERYATG